MLFYGVQGASSGIAGYGLGDAISDCVNGCSSIDTSTPGGQTDFLSCNSACNQSNQNGCVSYCNSQISDPTNYSYCSGACSNISQSSGSPSAGTGPGSGNSGRSGGASSGSGGNTGQPWWATLFGSAVQGSVSALVNKPAVATTPASFLTSPTGMAVIVVGLIAGVVLMTRK
jgi:hypothetical protein